jgi:xylulokinase
MARPTATIGVDVGTSATKGILLAEDGRILAQASADYPLLTPRPGWTEQDPEAWWRAAVAVLRELSASPAEIAGIGLSGQMHGSVFLDHAATVLRPALLWNDARTGEECREIERRVGAERLIAITGNRASAGFQAPKILWLRRHEPEHYARLAHVLLPKDLIRLRLTGAMATDVADAAGTLLVDLTQRRYSEELLSALEIPASWLPEAHEGTTVTGRVTAEAADLTGLPEGVPVVAGGGDNACAAIGAGIIRHGQGGCSLGTSGTVFLRSDRPVHDPAGTLNTFCDAAGGWHLMGVVLSAGGALRWFMDTVAASEAAVLRSAGLDPFAVLLEQAMALPNGTDGLVFLPYLAGERSPHMDPAARAAWVGLSLAHDRRHMLRAVIEGVGHAFTDCLEAMCRLGLEPSSLALVGGGARSRAWRQLLASQLRVELTIPASEQGPAVGAAILARVGVGIDPDLAAATHRVLPASVDRVRPEDGQVAAMTTAHARYAALYPALKAAGAFALSDGEAQPA